MKYDLDQNEEIDIIIINWKEYKVGDIPTYLMEKIQKIKTWFFGKNNIEVWKPIIEEIIWIKNKDFKIENLTNEKIYSFTDLILLKLEKWAIK